MSSVTGHGKAPLQTSLVSVECQRELVSGLDVGDLTMLLMLEVTVVIVVVVGPVTSKEMGKYETLGIGIAKVHLHQVCRQDQQLEVSIVQ